MFEGVRAVLEEALQSALRAEDVLSQTFGQDQKLFLLLRQISLGLTG